jgi:ubiquinone/menaquinone biosynthesis C-methylase UbiE
LKVLFARPAKQPVLRLPNQYWKREVPRGDMTVPEATDLIRDGVCNAIGATWVDFGAGRGVFTQALAALLGKHGSVIAIDRDRNALRELQRLSTRSDAAHIQVAHGDVTKLEMIAELSDEQIDGALFANVLHFIERPASVLTHVRTYMSAGGQVLIVEYDRRSANRWAPYPLPAHELAKLARTVGLSEPTEVGRRKSRYQGDLYCALMTWAQ